MALDFFHRPLYFILSLQMIAYLRIWQLLAAWCMEQQNNVVSVCYYFRCTTNNYWNSIVNGETVMDILHFYQIIHELN